MLLAAHGAGTVAQLVLTLALGIEVLARTSSGVWVSLTVALGFAPYVVFSGYAGLLADRYSRSLVLTVSFVSRAGGAVLLAVGLLAHWPVPVLVAMAAGTAVLATPSYPALAAATPECVADEQLTAANALVTGVENTTWIAGPGVLGLLLLSRQRTGPGHRCCCRAVRRRCRAVDPGAVAAARGGPGVGVRAARRAAGGGVPGHRSAGR